MLTKNNYSINLLAMNKTSSFQRSDCDFSAIKALMNQRTSNIVHPKRYIALFAYTASMGNSTGF